MSGKKLSLIDRRSLCAAGLSLAAGAFFPRNATASAMESMDVDNRLRVAVEGNKILVVDSITGETSYSVIDYEGKSAQIYYADGSSAEAYSDDAGNVYLNGRLMVSAVEVDEPLTRSVPSGYYLIATRRTPASAYDFYNGMTGAATSWLTGYLLSLIPSAGIAGILGVFMGALTSYFGSGYSYAYIEVKQYYNDSTYKVFTVVNIYKNSNYTGLIESREYGPEYVIRV